MQLIVADQPLALNLATTMDVYGTFMMGSPSCPIQSRITVTVPGGNATYGVDVWPGAQYDVHGVVEVSRMQAERRVSQHCYAMLLRQSCST